MLRGVLLALGLLIVSALPSAAQFNGCSGGFCAKPASSSASAGLGIDGSSTTFVSGGGSTCSTTLTTTQSNDVIIVLTGDAATTATTAPTVSGVTVNGAAATRRKQLTGTFANGYGLNLETWWVAAASPLSAVTVTATYSTTTGGCVVQAFGISGSANPSSPFDANVSLPATSQNLTNTSNQMQTTAVSTTNAATFLFSSFGSFTNLTLGSVDTGYSSILGAGGTASGAGGNYSIKIDTEYKIFSSAQTSATIAWGGANFAGNWSVIVDAVH